MSIQSDVEFLSIQIIESYAQSHNLNTDEVVSIFSKHHVFEKMLLQHEYLHQVSFPEVMEYICELMEDNSQLLTVYHGTCHKFDDIDLSKSHNYRDFGMGFYTTILEPQAKNWAYRLSLRTASKYYYVNEYSFLDDSSLKIKRFPELSEEWLEFVKENRTKGGIPHHYDIVIGPVADDKTMETLQLYLSGILNSKESIERLRYNHVNHQLSVHTIKGLEHLTFIRRTQYE
jgi:hypothetical protein